MKQKDMALIGAVIIFSAIVSLLISRVVFASPKNRQQQVEVVQPISANFPQPDSRYFNKNAFDPTQLITISENVNPNPFSSRGSSQ